jgi:hypothetical protein
MFEHPTEHVRRDQRETHRATAQSALGDEIEISIWDMVAPVSPREQRARHRRLRAGTQTNRGPARSSRLARFQELLSASNSANTNAPRITASSQEGLIVVMHDNDASSVYLDAQDLAKTERLTFFDPTIQEISQPTALGDVATLAFALETLLEQGAGYVLCESEGNGAFVQVLFDDDRRLRAEVASNAGLAEHLQLTRAGLARLRLLGWAPPRAFGEVTFWRPAEISTSSQRDELARLLHTVFREVFTLSDGAPLTVTIENPIDESEDDQ